MVKKCKKLLKDKIPNMLGAKAKLAGVAILVILITVTVLSIRKTVVINVDGKEQKIITYKSTIEDIVKQNGIEIDEKDKIEPSLNTKAKNNSTINIKKAIEIELVANNKTLKIKTAEDTVKNMINAESDYLKGQGIVFKEDEDEVTPDLNTAIDKNTKVTIVDVETVNEVALESIKFDTITEQDGNLDYGVEEVRQAGAEGEKEVTYKIVKKDGNEVSKNIISSKVVKEPVNEIIAEGTARAVATRNGMQRYKDVVYCQATAYCGDGITATGTVPVYNPGGTSTIAVDPRVIPLGSKVYVEGYGEAIAADTGGVIIGNIVDVFVDSYDQAISWGRKYDVPVYILAYPGEW